MTTATPTITVGWRLRMARERVGLQQAELATIIGVHKNTVSNYERDKVGMKVDVLERWATACGVDLAWVISGVTAGKPATPSPRVVGRWGDRPTFVDYIASSTCVSPH